MKDIQLSKNEVKELLRNGYGLSQKKEVGTTSGTIVAMVDSSVVIEPQYPPISPVVCVVVV
ncbi:hypothetical protein [Clostridium sp. BNL1100]|uniref:hypothetical protein n=1 Tax=Clostridium sp. BNL1100 TaxID=755731 RepID=UPI00024A71B0|nr:hypothetical protein [Clostridium sp. BNL1100]AEY67192.1 hypothetical protein Clo1100_3043 [Clostridium sp. BNL1100]